MADRVTKAETGSRRTVAALSISRMRVRQYLHIALFERMLFLYLRIRLSISRMRVGYFVHIALFERKLFLLKYRGMSCTEIRVAKAEMGSQRTASAVNTECWG